MQKILKKILKSRGLIYKLSLTIFKIILRIFLRTNKITIINNQEFIKQDKIFLLFWHNRSVMAPYFFPKKLLKHSIAIASNSKDGQIVSDYLQSWGIQIARGSYGKDSAVYATRKMIQHANKSKKGITAMGVDGPTGPKYEFKDGLVRLLGHVHIPIYLMSINYSKKWELKSWDQLQLPKPFGKITCTFERVSNKNINKENYQEVKIELTKKMLAITKD